MLEISYFKSVGTNLYGSSQLWVFKNLGALLNFTLFSQILGR